MKRGRWDHYRSRVIKTEEVTVLPGKPCCSPRGYFSVGARGEQYHWTGIIQLCGIIFARLLLAGTLRGQGRRGGSLEKAKRSGGGVELSGLKAKAWRLGAGGTGDRPLFPGVEVSGALSFESWESGSAHTSQLCGYRQEASPL